MNTYKKFYLFSVIGSILASFYPIYMGIVAISDYITNGSIDAANYPKYIIPYTPICIALIITVALLPLIFRFFKHFALSVASVLGVGIFFACEICFENMIVMEGITKVQLESWQMLSCMATPEVWKTIGNPLVNEYSPVFKIHFYIIAVIVILAILNVIYGFSKMIKENNYDKKKPLIAQAISATIFVGLCIFACFTAFFRSGNLNISAISAILMSSFFIVFGVTVGVYVGSFFYGMKKLLSVAVPSIVSMLTTIVMYVGELILMGGVLYKFGIGFFFEPLGVVPFAIIDIIVILLSGVVTYVIMKIIQKNKVSNGISTLS